MSIIKKIVKKLLYRMRGDHTTEQLIKNGLTVGSNFNRLIGSIIDPAHCWLITIGNDVTLAPRVHILAHDASTCHHLGYARIGRVDIGNNVFIGASTIVLPGVKIGDNVVVGANSTVSKDIPSNSVAVGSPARVICSIDEFIEKNKKLMAEGRVYGEDYTLRQNVSFEKRMNQKKDLLSGDGFVI